MGLERPLQQRRLRRSGGPVGGRVAHPQLAHGAQSPPPGRGQEDLATDRTIASIGLVTAF